MLDSKRVYVDFDDVLSETAKCITSFVESKFGKKVPFENLIFYDLDKSFNLNKKQLEELMDYLNAPESLLKMDPLPNVKESIQKWALSGHEICIVTGRPPCTYEVSLQWLDFHKIPYHRLFFVDKYNRSYASKSIKVWKLDEFRCQKFCLAVEDSAEIANFLVEEMNIKVALIDRPWNAHKIRAEASKKVIRCKDWQDIISRLPHPSKTSNSY